MIYIPPDPLAGIAVVQYSIYSSTRHHLLVAMARNTSSSGTSTTVLSKQTTNDGNQMTKRPQLRKNGPLVTVLPLQEKRESKIFNKIS